MEEQDKRMLGSRKGKLGKVRNSWGVRDAHKWIRKHHWYDIGCPIHEEDFYKIIRGVNKLFAEELKQGNSVHFPAGMGMLELRKYKAGVSFVNGQLKNTYPIDWCSTMKLWSQDNEARQQKLLLRIENPWVYHVKYCKHNATFENKCFYQFDLNRFIQKGLRNNIRAGKTDTVWGSELR